MEKRVRWLSSRPILAYKVEAGSAPVPGSNGKSINAAIEYVRPAIEEETYAEAVQEGLDAHEDHKAIMVNDPSIAPCNPSLQRSDPMEEGLDASFEGIAASAQSDEPSTAVPALPYEGDHVELY